MTLVLTELSNAGIAMAADSAITTIRGRVIEVDEHGWLKLIRVPSIKAAVSYWGMVGAVSKRMQFDQWLRRVIDSKNYSDLPSFADHLVNSLNEACKHKPLPDKHDMGIHVAGYHDWDDGVRRPYFYHVHNGHGRYGVMHVPDTQGSISVVIPKWQSDPRKLFEKHLDFPNESRTLEANLMLLQYGYITRNGDFFIYSVIWEKLSEAFDYINKIPNVSIPRDSSNLGSRKGLLHTILETIIRLYRCSNQSRIVGGTVSSLAISPKGYLPERRTRTPG